MVYTKGYMSKGTQRRKVVMVAGCPRSGSTILAKVLSLSHRTAYAEEPLNAQTGLQGTSEQFVYLHDGSALADTYDRIVTDMVSGRAKYKTSQFKPKQLGLGRRVFYALFTNRYNFQYKLGLLNPFADTLVSKDPTASLSAEYLHQKFGFDVILTLRHPCAVVASHQRLGWRWPIGRLLANPDLKEQLSKELRELKVEGLDSVESLAWYWRAINEMLLVFLKRNPDIKLVEHEHFSAQPQEVTKYLYGWFGLPYTSHVAATVARLTGANNATDPRSDRAHTLRRNSKENIARWKHLMSEADTERILAITGDVYQQLQAVPNNLVHDPQFAEAAGSAK